MGENILNLMRMNHRAMKTGRPVLEARQRENLTKMVRFAREESSFYREHFSELPDRVDRLNMLPPVTKPMLMERFNDWVTDRDVDFDDLQAFIADKGNVGRLYRDKYLACATSGTSGYRGVFLLGPRTTRIHSVLGLRKFASWLGLRDALRIVMGGARIGAVLATGDHFAAYAGITAATRNRTAARHFIRVFSVHAPISELVDDLNAWRPAILIGYARTIAQLADEQAAGRLAIKPALVSVTAESLDPHEYRKLSEAFGVRAHDNYGCTEAAELSYDCAEGWHHYNMDWHGFEPVDADYHPVPPGEQSHTVLLTNLINRVQPILRYDLGDSVLVRPDPCPCGNPLPAFRVVGRASQVVTLRDSAGDAVSIAPMAFTGALERVRSAQQYQVVQIDERSLELRFTPREDADATWTELSEILRDMLKQRNLGDVAIDRANEPPEQTRGGKYQPVIPASS